MKKNKKSKETLKLEPQKVGKMNLSPCPFCGMNTVKIIPFDKNKFILCHWYKNIANCPIATADENTGIGTTYFETEEEAMEMWNKRYI